jgi:glucose-6-phosphate 1-epimerase
LLFVFVCLQKTKIHDFGACLVSYKTGTGRECIFVSRDAKLDGSKAIRGGCPLVFPQFGQSDKSMPQHGFLRVNFWKADESTMYDNEDGAGITYTLDLKDVEQARGGKWDENTSYDCTCLFHVKIYSQSFSTKLEIKNTGENEFEFQTLLHTYYLVDGKAALDGSKCYVKGLEGTHVFIFCFFADDTYFIITKTIVYFF